MDPHGYTDDFSRPGEVLIIRHPQTVANASHRYLGQVNASFTELGEQQRERAVQALVRFQPGRILSSPLSRCLAIAQPAAEILACSLSADERLMEMNFGALENLTYNEAVAQGYPFPWGETSDRWPAPHAESLECFRERTDSVAREIARFEGRTAIVTHGGTTRGLFASWFGLGQDALWQFVVGNVSCCILRFDGEYRAYLEQFGLQPEQIRGRD